MHIVYGYSNCTDKKYAQIFEGKKVAVLQPDQKYHGLLIRGLAKNGANVKCYSGLPLNRSVTKKLIIWEKNEREDGVSYHYYKTVNLPFFRQCMIACAGFFSVLFQKKKNKPIIVCDCLNKANTMGMLKAARLKKIPVVMIVTDLPDFQFDEGYSRNFNNKLLTKADGFIFLTEQMNERINLNNKPYIVLEGHSDESLTLLEREESYERQTGKRIIVYAGSIKKLYGIQNLVEGFIQANIPDAELHVFGDGDYREELESLSLRYPTVRYMGIRPNAEIVEEEQRAALLVNPRPTEPEYTKYSFPSKNMEYMVSGTPLMTTKLPGMPKEYYPHVYLLEEETVEGVANKLQEIFALPLKEREEKGLQAREFVLNSKSNVVQARKILNFLEENY